MDNYFFFLILWILPSCYYSSCAKRLGALGVLGVKNSLFTFVPEPVPDPSSSYEL